MSAKIIELIVIHVQASCCSRGALKVTCFLRSRL